MCRRAGPESDPSIDQAAWMLRADDFQATKLIIRTLCRSGLLNFGPRRAYRLRRSWIMRDLKRPVRAAIAALLLSGLCGQDLIAQSRLPTSTSG